MMSGDEELGWVYLPIGTPTNDYYGGPPARGQPLRREHRRRRRRGPASGSGTSRRSTTACGTTTCRRLPNLLDITVDGREIKAVAQVSKQGFVYVFEPRDGGARVAHRGAGGRHRHGPRGRDPLADPAVPDEAGPVRVPGDLDRRPRRLHAGDPADGRRCRPGLPGWGRSTRPQTLRGTIMRPPVGGGASWSGAAVDPETGYLYVPSFNGHLDDSAHRAGSRTRSRRCATSGAPSPPAP